MKRRYKTELGDLYLHDDWVSKDWDGTPIEIPVKGAP
jgi:hypothetical protein